MKPCPFHRMDLIQRDWQDTIFVGHFLGEVADIDGETGLTLMRTAEDIYLLGKTALFKPYDPKANIGATVIKENSEPGKYLPAHVPSNS